MYLVSSTRPVWQDETLLHFRGAAFLMEQSFTEDQEEVFHSGVTSLEE